MSKSSELEELFLAELHRLCPAAPEPERQTKLIEGRNFQVDFYFPWYLGRSLMFQGEWRLRGLVVEVDGGQHKAGGGRHNTDEDRFKINRLSMLGYCVLRFSGSMLANDPLTCISQVAEVLGVPMREEVVNRG